MTARSAALEPEHPGRPHEYPSFELPSFPRFRPALYRPGIETLEARCRTWLAHALRDAHADCPEEFEQFLAQRTTLWNLLVYATTDIERVTTICHWIDVLFSIDDLFAHAPAQRLERLGLHRLHTALDGRQAPGQAPYPRVLAILSRQLRHGMPPALWDRFSHEMKGFFDACRTERLWQDTRTAIDLTAYEASRGKSIGECCFPLLEYGLGTDLTRTLAHHPELGRLNTLVARHWIGVNDIFSYRKELYSGDTMNEITLALAGNGGNLQAAVDRITQTIRRTEDEFCALSECLLRSTAHRNPAVAGYVKALRWMIAGNLEWSCITTRYNGSGHVWNGHTDTTVILTPHRTLYTSSRGSAKDPSGLPCP
ncbi:terpene synthase family protein [Streptomyces syringium]|uniref:terpene synthase family protein n=1 Tax=Streptomyces syringium TaxID=76729 RepID=UPI003AAE9F23